MGWARKTAQPFRPAPHTLKTNQRRRGARQVPANSQRCRCLQCCSCAVSCKVSASSCAVSQLLDFACDLREHVCKVGRSGSGQGQHAAALRELLTALLEQPGAPAGSETAGIPPLTKSRCTPCCSS